MKKKKDFASQLETTINNIVTEYPPLNDKNILKAYQSFVAAFPGRISYPIWTSIYLPHRTPPMIIKDILSAPKPPKVSNNLGGWGGARGIERQWKIFKEADNIFFDTENILEKFKLQIDPRKFLSLIGPHSEGMTAQYSGETRKALSYCLMVLGIIFNKFVEKLNLQSPKHQDVIRILFGENFPLYIAYEPHQGRRITKAGLSKAVNEIRKHIHGQSKPKADQKLYTDKKFYYMAYLARLSCALGIPFFDNDKEAAITKINEILSSFSNSQDRMIILQKCLDNEKDSSPALSLLSPPSK